MKVSSQVEVTNLNAALLDGNHASHFAAAYKLTVVVSPVGTDTENGTALLDALSGITDASARALHPIPLRTGLRVLLPTGLAQTVEASANLADQARYCQMLSIGF
jgi:hypothetical protein